MLSQSAIFFVAGRESSVSTICFTLYELAKHPEIQKRTREEINEKLKEHGMTYEGVQNMKYLHQVVSEVLRLYPPAPLIDRIAVSDYKVRIKMLRINFIILNYFINYLLTILNIYILRNLFLKIYFSNLYKIFTFL